MILFDQNVQEKVDLGIRYLPYTFEEPGDQEINLSDAFFHLLRVEFYRK